MLTVRERPPLVVPFDTLAAALARLAPVTDPAAWGSLPVRPVSFTPAQFSRANFVVFTGLPGHLVVAVRRS
jgi:hypothetical protein